MKRPYVRPEAGGHKGVALCYGEIVPGMEQLVLAIDAGGSSTRAALIRNDGTVLGSGRGGPGNHTLAAWDSIREAYAKAVGETFASAGVRRSDVVVAGSAGVGPGGEMREPIETLLGELVGETPRRLVTGDMVTAFWGALQDPVGAVVCAGTGSVCFARSAEGRSCQVGGWGPLMGDEGSAYDIGLQALRAVARSTDGRIAATLLGERLMAATSARSPVEVALRVYDPDFGRERVAALAVQVAAAAQQGDTVATEILHHAGRELGLAAVAALRRLDLLAETVTVSFAGAVFEAGALVLDAFVAMILSEALQAHVKPPHLPPLGGAFRLALRELGGELDAPTAATLSAGLAAP